MEIVADQSYQGRLPYGLCSETVFLRCEFSSIVVTSGRDLIFKECIFDSCVFRSGTNQTQIGSKFSKLSFYDCLGRHVEFRSTVAEDLNIIRPNAELEWKFTGVRFKRALKIESCNNLLQLSVDQTCSFSESFFELVVDSKISFFKNMFLWNTIEFVQSLKLPQAGLAVALVFAFLTSFFDLGLFKFHMNFGNEKWEDISLIAEVRFPFIRLEALGWCTLTLLILSVIHLVIRPEECAVNSRVTWQNEYRKSYLQLLWFRKQNPLIRHFLVISYTVISVYVGSEIIQKLI